MGRDRVSDSAEIEERRARDLGDGPLGAQEYQRLPAAPALPHVGFPGGR